MGPTPSLIYGKYRPKGIVVDSDDPVSFVQNEMGANWQDQEFGLLAPTHRKETVRTLSLFAFVAHACRTKQPLLQIESLCQQAECV